jgi:uncharacterized membrane protein
MSDPPTQANDEHIVQTIGNLLRAGVVMSALVVFLGGGVYLARHGHEVVPRHQVIQTKPPEFSGPEGILRLALSLRGRAVIQIGLLLLIATPVIRVVFSVFAFARKRDYVYTIIPLIVLAVLLYSLLSGQLG